jgi:predicted nuclease of predicted toxin-antitoxin system
VKLKLDQNLGLRGSDLFEAAGHDVCTAHIQGLDVAAEEAIWRRTLLEGRVLVTLDLDFADTLRFPPGEHAGVAVLRVPEHRGSGLLPATMKTLVQALRSQPIKGRLWVVEPGRQRIYQAEDNAWCFPLSEL